jgi:hypothetical protein
MVVQIVEGAQRIEGQVCRVLLASYTVSLEDVFKVLQTVSDDSIKLWAKVNVCRLESLANIVVETLEICPLSFIVLGRLSSAVQFRDAVFRTCPSLLAQREKVPLAHASHQFWTNNELPSESSPRLASTHLPISPKSGSALQSMDKQSLRIALHSISSSSGPHCTVMKGY